MQALIDPLFPGFMGVRLVTVEPERVVAEMAIRAELCTWRESTTRTIWQVASRV